MARKINRLTPAAVRAAKKDTCDGYVLWLQVSRYDTNSWLFRYTCPVHGKADSMGLGALNTASLAKARERAARARDLLADGINPRLHRDADRAAQKAEAAKQMTFEECANAYIKANRSGWKNDKHAAQWESTFTETRLGSKKFPPATAIINDLPVATIDTALVRKVLERIWYSTPESASRIRGRIERVLAWATVSGYRTGDNPARWTGHLKELLPAKGKIAKVKHHDALPYREMGQFLSEVRAKPGVSARALEFTALTAARTGEVIGAGWEEIDLEVGIWTIPGERMKAGREHRIPLSDRALEILVQQPRSSAYIFEGRKSGEPLSNMSMLKLIRDMRGAGATTHGLRSTSRDRCAEHTSYPNEMAEIALAHVVSDKTEAAYRRGDMMEKRRRLMADWAAYCAKPVTAPASSNVHSIREAV